MQHILTQLQKLDSLYYSGSLDVYEMTWQTVESQIRQMLPGFTIAYAEIYMAGSAREPDGRMTHVLLPIKEQEFKDEQINESERTE